MTIATGDSVTIEYTGRLDDGTVFDTSRASVAEEAGLADGQPDRKYDPLTIEVGAEEVLEGMEEGLLGLEAGTTTTLSIPPEKAYGERSEEHVQQYETEALREMLDGKTPEVGAFLESGDGRHGEVIHADADTVRVDFNPRLAGETLTFEVEVLDVN